MNKLSTEFSYLLYKEVGIEKILEINRRNKDGDEEDFLICYSHDFCDSNMVMEEALRKTHGKDIDIHSNESIVKWNEAWEEAKKENFFIDRSIYLEYVNEYITEKRMAEKLNTDPIELDKAIIRGRILHENIVSEFHSNNS
tara:strand:+ start:991 stop:1413 length:423 start_codon:yes stop_codon:yes gene_type:complete